MRVLPHLRLILTFSSRYLATAIAMSLRLRSACAHSSLAIRAAGSGSSAMKRLRHVRSEWKKRPRLCANEPAWRETFSQA
jgi:hypothetical protein